MNLRYHLICLRFTAESWVRRRIAVAPWLRLAAVPLWIAGAVALVISGLITEDYLARAVPGLLVGFFFLYLGAMCWGLE